MSADTSNRIVDPGWAAADALIGVFADDPGVGFAIVDISGVIRFLNDRSAAIFLGTPADRAIGKNVWSIFEADWVAERMAVFERMIEHRRPVVFRHICRGRRVQSTLRLLPIEAGHPESLSIVTVEGEHDPADNAVFEVVESRFADLGPLASLTRRELEVLSLLGHGMTSAQIAEALYRSPKTIEKHLDGLRSKLGNANRVQLSEYARAAKLRLSDATLQRSSRLASINVAREPDPSQPE